MPRLFFALRPQAPERAAINAAALPMVQALAGRSVEQSDLHLTICFLGEVTDAVLPHLLERTETSTCGVISLALTRVDCWLPARVLCLLPEDECVPPALATLAATLRDTGIACGLAVDPKPFRPHVTAGRKLSPPRVRSAQWPQPLPEPLPFTANGFALMQSARAPTGPRYTVLRDWPAVRGA
jgi:2'-5' RNA ligase